MKILCSCHVYHGWEKVFRVMGHDFIYWQPEVKPAFDVFVEYSPDLFIGKASGLDRATRKCILARPDMKVALHEGTSALLGDGMHVDFFFTHAMSDKVVTLLPAADTFIYYTGKPTARFISEISIVNHISEAEKNLIIPLCYDGTKRVKLFGNKPWSFPQYLGFIKDEAVRNIYASARICPYITDCEADITEHPFNILASGGFCIANHHENILGITVPQVKTKEEFYTKVEYYLEHTSEAMELAKQGRMWVLHSETYFDRVATLFHHLDMTNEVNRALALKGEYLCSTE